MSQYTKKFELFCSHTNERSHEKCSGYHAANKNQKLFYFQAAKCKTLQTRQLN